MAFIEKIIKIDEYSNIPGFNEPVNFSWTTQMVGTGEHDGMNGPLVTSSAVPGYVADDGLYSRTDFSGYPIAIQFRVQQHWTTDLHAHYERFLIPSTT